METDPLERMAAALIDEIRARRTTVSEPVPLSENSPEEAPPIKSGASRASIARKRERRTALYPAHYSLRLTDEDRDRFDACAERHGLAKGELFRRMIDAFEAAENRPEK